MPFLLQASCARFPESAAPTAGIRRQEKSCLATESLSSARSRSGFAEFGFRHHSRFAQLQLGCGVVNDGALPRSMLECLISSWKLNRHSATKFVQTPSLWPRWYGEPGDVGTEHLDRFDYQVCCEEERPSVFEHGKLALSVKELCSQTAHACRKR